MLIKPLERSTVVVQVHQNKQEHKNVFFYFISKYYVICFQTKYCEIKLRVHIQDHIQFLSLHHDTILMALCHV